jgi:hypothetical protein
MFAEQHVADTPLRSTTIASPSMKHDRTGSAATPLMISGKRSAKS